MPSYLRESADLRGFSTDSLGINLGRHLPPRMLIRLSFATACRVSQLEGIRILGKGRRGRELPLWKETKAVLNEWLDVLAANVNDIWQGENRYLVPQRTRLPERLTVIVAGGSS